MTDEHDQAASETAITLSDLSLARVIAHAVCQVPGVLAMSPGRFALEATYGPGEHIAGVILHRPAPEMLVVTVRVLMAEQAVMAAMNEVAAYAPAAAEGSPLDQFAERIRTAVAQVVQQVGIETLTAIHVAIDDIG